LQRKDSIAGGPSISALHRDLVVCDEARKRLDQGLSDAEEPGAPAVKVDDRSVTFFFPYHEVSGVPVLFLTMARYLAKEAGRKVRVVDYVDGFMARSLDEFDSVELIPFEHGRPCVITGEMILVMQSILPYRMLPELLIGSEVTLLFWHLFPINLFYVLAPWRGLRELPLYHPRLYRALMKCLHPRMHRAIKGYLRSLNDHRGMVYYDRSTIEITSDGLGAPISDPVLVPIPIEVPVDPVKGSLHAPGAFTVAWVGRLCDFKIHILIHVLRRFSYWSAQFQTAVEFHVIGDGEEAWRLDDLQLEHSQFRVRRLGVISGERLREHFLVGVDLVTAMGQSALESGRLGLPTILLDFSYRKIEGDYRFRWLDETTSGDLGHLISESDMEASDSLPSMMEGLRADYASYVRRAHEYCRHNHDIRTVGRTFYKAALGSNMTMDHVPDALMRRGILRRLYDRARYGRVPQA
jgi:glycosyltransferase involved in cell wall biosynthesis